MKVKDSQISNPEPSPRCPRPKLLDDYNGIKISSSNQNGKLQSYRSTNEPEHNVEEDATSKLVNEILAMKAAIAEYQESENKWRLDLERKEAELVNKLGEFEDITKRVLKCVQLSDGQPAEPELSQEVNSKVVAKVLSEVSKQSSDEGEGESGESEVHITESEIYKELKEVDKETSKAAVEIRTIQIAISEYQKLKENYTGMKDDTKWLEDRQMELMMKLAEFEEITKKLLHFIGLAEISLIEFDETQTESTEESKSDRTDSEGDEDMKSTASSISNTSLRNSIHKKLKEADEEACKKAEEILRIKIEFANYRKKKEKNKLQEEDKKWLERKKSELIEKLEEFEEVTKKVKLLVSMAEYARVNNYSKTKRLPTNLDDTAKQETGNGSWIKFMRAACPLVEFGHIADT